MAQTVENPLAMWETWVRSLGCEDPLEEGMTTHSSILARKILMNRGAWRAAVHGVTKSQTWMSKDTRTYQVLLFYTPGIRESIGRLPQEVSTTFENIYLNSVSRGSRAWVKVVTGRQGHQVHSFPWPRQPTRLRDQSRDYAEVTLMLRFYAPLNLAILRWSL